MGIQRHQVVIAALLIVGGLGYLFFTGMQGNMVFYYTVGEVLEQRDTLAGRPLRIAGKVVPGTIEKSPSNYLDVRFVIHEGDERVPVEFHGTVPDTLVDDSDAVVAGAARRRRHLPRHRGAGQVPFQVRERDGLREVPRGRRCHTDRRSPVGSGTAENPAAARGSTASDRYRPSGTDRRAGHSRVYQRRRRHRRASSSARTGTERFVTASTQPRRW